MRNLTSLDAIVIGNMAPLSARDQKNKTRQTGENSVHGICEFQQGIFRTIKRLKLLGSWFSERSADFYSV